ncbi:MAG: hypothetical protein ACEPOV_02015 [Hyphomicrobiales bacterium]
MCETTSTNVQEQDYIKATPSMLEIPSNQVQKPNMPVSTAIHEAETLLATAQRMEVQLSNAGLSSEQIDALKTRVNILRHAQSLWTTNYRAKQEDIKNWNIKKKEGRKYQKLLKNTCKYAYANDNLLYGRVKAIKKGTSDKEMVQDLNDYCALAKEYPDHLTAINFDISKIEKIQTLANELGDLYGKAMDQKKKQYEHKDMRDRAFTMLHQSVKLIRECGKFLFADRPDIKRLFTSDYTRKQYNKRHNKENSENSEKE